MYSKEIQSVTLMQELSLYKIQHRRKTIQKLVSIFGGMLDKGEKWDFLEDKFPKPLFNGGEQRYNAAMAQGCAEAPEGEQSPLCIFRN